MTLFQKRRKKEKKDIKSIVITVIYLKQKRIVLWKTIRFCFIEFVSYFATTQHFMRQRLIYKDRPALFSQNYPNNFTEDFLRKIRKKENCYH